MSKEKRNPGPTSPWERALAQRLGISNGEALPADPTTQEAYPNLWAMLSWREQGEEFLKEGSTVSISLGVGCYVVRISDADTGLSKETAAPTLAQAFEAINTAIGDDRVPWRYWKGKEPTLRKRRKDST